MSEDDVRVVVVDDFIDAAEALAETLMMSGYKVWVATDGAGALALIETHQPHCVLLDIGMPGMDGNELTRTLRTRYGDDIVLIAVTGREHDDERVSDTFARVDHYLQKPVDPDVLRKLLPPRPERGISSRPAATLPCSAARRWPKTRRKCASGASAAIASKVVSGSRSNSFCCASMIALSSMNPSRRLLQSDSAMFGSSSSKVWR